MQNRARAAANDRYPSGLMPPHELGKKRGRYVIGEAGSPPTSRALCSAAEVEIPASKRARTRSPLSDDPRVERHRHQETPAPPVSNGFLAIVDVEAPEGPAVDNATFNPQGGTAMLSVEVSVSNGGSDDVSSLALAASARRGEMTLLAAPQMPPQMPQMPPPAAAEPPVANQVTDLAKQAGPVTMAEPEALGALGESQPPPRTPPCVPVRMEPRGSVLLRCDGLPGGVMRGGYDRPPRHGFNGRDRWTFDDREGQPGRGYGGEWRGPPPRRGVGDRGPPPPRGGFGGGRGPPRRSRFDDGRGPPRHKFVDGPLRRGYDERTPPRPPSPQRRYGPPTWAPSPLRFVSYPRATPAGGPGSWPFSPPPLRAAPMPASRHVGRKSSLAWSSVIRPSAAPPPRALRPSDEGEEDVVDMAKRKAEVEAKEADEADEADEAVVADEAGEAEEAAEASEADDADEVGEVDEAEEAEEAEAGEVAQSVEADAAEETLTPICDTELSETGSETGEAEDEAEMSDSTVRYGSDDDEAESGFAQNGVAASAAAAIEDSQTAEPSMEPAPPAAGATVRPRRRAAAAAAAAAAQEARRKADAVAVEAIKTQEREAWLNAAKQEAMGQDDLEEGLAELDREHAQSDLEDGAEREPGDYDFGASASKSGSRKFKRQRTDKKPDLRPHPAPEPPTPLEPAAPLEPVPAPPPTSAPPEIPAPAPAMPGSSEECAIDLDAF